MSLKNIYLVGLPNTGKHTLMALISYTLSRRTALKSSILRGSELINKLLAGLNQGQLPENIDGDVVIQIEQPGFLKKGLRIELKEITDGNDMPSLYFSLRTDGYIFVIDSTASTPETDSTYTTILSNIKKVKDSMRVEPIAIAITKCDLTEIINPVNWLTERYPLFYSEIKSSATRWSIYTTKIHTTDKKPVKPLIIEGPNLLLSWLLENSGPSAKDMTPLISALTLPRDAQKRIISNLVEIDKLVNIVFRDYQNIQNMFNNDYRLVVYTGLLMDYIFVITNIARNLPPNNVTKIQIYKNLIQLTGNLFNITNMEEYKYLCENFRNESTGRRELKLDDILQHIQFEVNFSGKVIKEQGNTGDITISNRSPEKIMFSAFKLSSEKTDIKLYGDTEFELSAHSKISLKFWMHPKISGTIVLQYSGEIQFKEEKKNIEKYFEIFVEEQRKVEMQQPVITPIKLQPAISSEQTPVQTSVVTTQPSSSMIDIEYLIKKGKIEEWLKTINESIQSESVIDLSKYSSFAKIYKERGYRNLLHAIFEFDISTVTIRDILSVIKGDEFTERGLSSLYNLRKKNKIEFIPGVSDIDYVTGVLNILTGNDEIPIQDRKKIKEWKIAIPGKKELLIKKEVEKNESGKASKIMFVIV